MAFLGAFFETMQREWSGIDRLRYSCFECQYAHQPVPNFQNHYYHYFHSLDKYYMLITDFLSSAVFLVKARNNRKIKIFFFFVIRKNKVDFISSQANSWDESNAADLANVIQGQVFDATEIQVSKIFKIFGKKTPQKHTHTRTHTQTHTFFFLILHVTRHRSALPATCASRSRRGCTRRSVRRTSATSCCARSCMRLPPRRSEFESVRALRDCCNCCC